MSLPSILPGYLRILIYACPQPAFVSHCALALASWSSCSPYTCVRVRVCVCIACHTACWLRLRRGSNAAVALFKSQRTCESLLSLLYPPSWLPLSDLACCSPVNRNAIVITRTVSVPPLHLPRDSLVPQCIRRPCHAQLLFLLYLQLVQLVLQLVPNHKRGCCRLVNWLPKLSFPLSHPCTSLPLPPLPFDCTIACKFKILIVVVHALQQQHQQQQLH